MNCIRFGHTSNRRLLYGALTLILIVSLLTMHQRTSIGIHTTRTLQSFGENDIYSTKTSFALKRSFKNLPFSSNSDIHTCDRAYPSNRTSGLFARVYDDFQPFLQRKISAADIRETSIGCSNCHHVQIIDNELYVVQRPFVADYETRGRSVALLLKQVTETFVGIPNLELFYDVQDVVKPYDVITPFPAPVFGIVKMNNTRRGLHADGIVLMPCFSFWSFPETRAGRWTQRAASILDSARRSIYEQRASKLFWRGEIQPRRARLLAQVKKYPDLADVGVVTWMDSNDSIILRPSSMYTTLEDHCNYKYLLHLEGHSYSSRLKYLLLCGSPVIYPAVEYWQEYWYHLFENGSNIILLSADAERNGTLFEQALNYLRNHEQEAKEIGRRGQQLVRDYLNEQAVICYWWKLLVEYAKLIDHSPRRHPYAVHIKTLIRNDSALRRTSGQPPTHVARSLLVLALLLVFHARSADDTDSSH